jgi:hypothetical protein
MRDFPQQRILLQQHEFEQDTNQSFTSRISSAETETSGNSWSKWSERECAK